MTVAKDTVCEVGLELESCKPGEICSPLHSKSRYCTRDENLCFKYVKDALLPLVLLLLVLLPFVLLPFDLLPIDLFIYH